MDKKTIKHLISLLRHGTIEWHIRSKVINRDRKHVQIGTFKNGSPKYKYYYRCQKCKEYFEDKSVLELDHIVEIGHIDISNPLAIDWTSVIYKMYCDESNLQGLCGTCHQKKTRVNASLRYTRKGNTTEDDLF